MLLHKKRPLSFSIFGRLRKAVTILLTTSSDNNDSTEIKSIPTSNFKIERLLIEEYKFRGNCLIQLLHDFTGTFNLYFVLLGISISGLGVTYQFIGNIRIYLEQIIVIVLIVLGIANFLFFVRFISLVNIYLRNKTCMNIIREYYIKHFQNELPDIRTAFRLSMDYSASYKFRFILYSVLAIVDGVCFAGAAFLSVELWLHINNGSLLPLPSDVRPYIIALVVSIVVLLFHVLFSRLTLHEYGKKNLEI